MLTEANLPPSHACETNPLRDLGPASSLFPLRRACIEQCQLCSESRGAPQRVAAVILGDGSCATQDSRNRMGRAPRIHVERVTSLSVPFSEHRAGQQWRIHAADRGAVCGSCTGPRAWEGTLGPLQCPRHVWLCCPCLRRRCRRRTSVAWRTGRALATDRSTEARSGLGVCAKQSFRAHARARPRETSKFNRSVC